jgi:hypothetical protein
LRLLLLLLLLLQILLAQTTTDLHGLLGDEPPVPLIAHARQASHQNVPQLRLRHTVLHDEQHPARGGLVVKPLLRLLGGALGGVAGLRALGGVVVSDLCHHRGRQLPLGRALCRIDN